MPHITRKADLIWNPWKNGAGQMADVAVSTERTPAGDPVWRVSVARVERDSAFSHFPDVERGMMLIEGERLDLHVAHDAPLRVAALGPAVTFAGDRPTRGAPSPGPILNLNVMVQRIAVRQRMIRWTLDGPMWLPVAAGGHAFVFVQRGRVTCAGQHAEPGDTVRLDGPGLIAGQAELIEINIWPV